MTTYYVAAPVLGSELFSNSDFSTDTGWTGVGSNGWAYNTGTGEVEGTSTTGNVTQALGLTIGSRYRISANITSFTSGYFYLNIDTTNIATIYQAGEGAGVFSGYHTATVGSGHSGLYDGNGVTLNMTSLSCKEVTKGGDGSIGDPWLGCASIGYGTALQPGDVVVFTEDQDYDGLHLSGLNGTAANPITFRAYQGVKFQKDASDGFVYKLGSASLTNCSYIIIDGLTTHGNFTTGDWIPGSSDRANSINLTNSSNITIRGCTLQNSYGRGVVSTDSSCADVKVLGNTITGNPCGGISLSVATTSLWDTQIVGNSITFNGNEPQDRNGDGNAMHANCPDMLVAYNYIEYNGDPNTDRGTAEDFEISCDGNQGSGTGVNAYNITIVGNYIKDALTGGIQIFENCYGCTVSHNIINGFNQLAFSIGTYGIAAGLRIGTQNATNFDESDTLVYNNIFMGNENGATAGAVSPCILIGHESGGSADHSGCKFYNNIFYNCDGMFWFIDDLADISNIEIDYNIYWNTNETYASNAWHCGQLTGGSTYNTFTGWQNTGATALSSPDANGANSDPLIDAYFFPASNSPCWDNGTTPIRNYDVYGRPNYGSHVGAVWPAVTTSTDRRDLTLSTTLTNGGRRVI